MSGPTPGPWHYGRVTIGDPDNVRNPMVTAPGRNIARLFSEGARPGLTSDAPPFKEAEANARLIAEAPEMKDQMILCANHLRSLAVIGRTLTAADVAAIEARVREARLTLERVVVP